MTRLRPIARRWLSHHVRRQVPEWLPERPERRPPGWDEWFGLAGEIHRGYDYRANHNRTIETFGSATADYQTDLLAVEAVRFLNSTESADDEPFFLYVAPTAPHASIPPARRTQ